MVNPISLRIRAAEATANARALLRRLDESDTAQKCTKLHAARALSAIHKMDAVAQPKLRTLSRGGREDWEAQLQSIKRVLTRIIARGI
jgi:hypothetical protein